MKPASVSRRCAVLSQRNGAILPYLHVEAMIDGRGIVALHGDRNMPLWERNDLQGKEQA